MRLSTYGARICAARAVWPGWARASHGPRREPSSTPWFETLAGERQSSSILSYIFPVDSGFCTREINFCVKPLILDNQRLLSGFAALRAMCGRRGHRSEGVANAALGDNLRAGNTGRLPVESASRQGRTNRRSLARSIGARHTRYRTRGQYVRPRIQRACDSAEQIWAD